LLLQVPRGILRVGCTNSGADDRPGGGPDPGAPTAANRGTDRCPEPGAKESAADRLGIGLVAQRGDLRVGKLPASLIVVIRLRESRGAHRERRQNRGSDEV
jgi:hypothetical protein